MTTLVSRMNPYMVDFRGVTHVWCGAPSGWTEQHAAAFKAIGELVDKADVKREGMAATSFDVALAKFNALHHQENPYETLVDLATALEAILAGGEKETEGLTLRLRNRAAALLATRRRSGQSELRRCRAAVRAAFEVRPRRPDQTERSAPRPAEDLDDAGG